MAHGDSTLRKLAVKRGGLASAHISARLLELSLFILKEVEGPAKDESVYKQFWQWPFISGCGAAACDQSLKLLIWGRSSDDARCACQTLDLSSQIACCAAVDLGRTVVVRLARQGQRRMRVAEVWLHLQNSYRSRRSMHNYPLGFSLLAVQSCVFLAMKYMDSLVIAVLSTWVLLCDMSVGRRCTNHMRQQIHSLCLKPYSIPASNIL